MNSWRELKFVGRRLASAIAVILVAVGWLVYCDEVRTSVEVIDAPRWLDLGPHAVAADSWGRMHVAYGQDHLYYAVQTRDGWTTTVVDSSSAVGISAAIALDSSDNPHIAYLDQANGRLKLATLDAGEWEIEDVSEANDGGGVCITIDSASSVVIAFEAPGGEIRCGRSAGGVWSFDPVVKSQEGFGPNITLILDSHGIPHIVYLPYGDMHVWHAKLDGGEWVLEDVTPDGNCWGQSFALDAEDNLHLSYRSGLSLLVYAFRSSSGGSWRYEVVQDSCNPAESSVVLDNSGVPHIAFVDLWTSRVRYASQFGGVWLVTTVDTPFQFGSISAATTHEGAPVLAYCKADSWLKSAVWKDNSWSIEAIDSGAYVGRESALAIDSAGRAWVAYTASAAVGLGVRDSLGWHLEDIGNAADYSDTPVSLAITSDDTVVICHTGGGFDDRRLDAPWTYNVVVSWMGAMGRGESVVFGDTEASGAYPASMSSAPNDRIGVLVLTSQSSLLLAEGFVREDTWAFRTVLDDSGASANSAVIASDADGVFHIACLVYDESAGQSTLYYVRSDDLENPEVVETGSILASPHIAVDADGRVYILYSSAEDIYGGSSRVRFAERYDGTWHLSAVDETLEGYPGGLTVDKEGIPHVCYAASADFDPIGGFWKVMYGVRRGADWETHQLTEGYGLYPNAITVDDTGVVHIACHEFGNGDLLYIRVGE